VGKDRWPGSASDNLRQAFEGIEKESFRHDGFDDGLKQIAATEREFGLEGPAASAMLWTCGSAVPVFYVTSTENLNCYRNICLITSRSVIDQDDQGRPP
jgi:hypothetical protein